MIEIYSNKLENFKQTSTTEIIDLELFFDESPKNTGSILPILYGDLQLPRSVLYRLIYTSTLVSKY